MLIINLKSVIKKNNKNPWSLRGPIFQRKHLFFNIHKEHLVVSEKQHCKIKEDLKWFWPFPAPHAATIFNLPNLMDIGVFVSFLQFTFQAVLQMLVILAIQIAGESLFSVSSVFQELFSTKLSPAV